MARIPINPRVISAHYAVRGVLPLRADIIQSELDKDPNSHPFPRVTYLNIGNPQQLDQKPLTFLRQVLSLVQYPQLIDDADKLNHSWSTKHSLFPSDTLERAKFLLKNIGSVGAYSHSQGVPVIRESVAKFITKRDGFPADPNDIFLCAGASSAVEKIMAMLSSDSEKVGMLVPVPQYPLYSATCSLVGAEQLGYSLDEHHGWDTGIGAIEEAYNDAVARGVSPRLLVVINPGNPTGSNIHKDSIADILKFAKERNLLIIADEVYQTNLFDGQKFTSFKQVRSELAQQDASYNQVALASLHSTSKGFLGECGQRGGYTEVVGLTSEAREQLYKLFSISLCSVVTGQVCTEVMVNPPKPGDPSYPLYHKEQSETLERMERRGNQLFEAFYKMRGVECQKPQGAMYLFPRISLPENAIIEAKRQGLTPDTFYAMALLNQTGICVVPGSGFGQEEGTFHFRTTFLAPGGEDLSQRFIEFHNAFMDKYE